MSIMTFIFGFLATKSDPTDPIYYKEMEARKKKIPYSPDATRYCTVCTTYVQEKTKHCGSCNRCVCEFDHHCQWLNNCIGGQNYKYFIGLLISVLGMTLLGTILCVSYFALMIQDYDEFLQKVKKSTIQYSEEQALGFIISYFALDPFIIPFISDILIYHAWLNYKKITTYDHILMKREALEKKQMELERKKQRIKKERENNKRKEKKKHAIRNISELEIENRTDQNNTNNNYNTNNNIKSISQFPSSGIGSETNQNNNDQQQINIAINKNMQKPNINKQEKTNLNINAPATENIELSGFQPAEDNSQIPIFANQVKNTLDLNDMSDSCYIKKPIKGLPPLSRSSNFVDIGGKKTSNNSTEFGNSIQNYNIRNQNNNNIVNNDKYQKNGSLQNNQQLMYNSAGNTEYFERSDKFEKSFAEEDQSDINNNNSSLEDEQQNYDRQDIILQNNLSHEDSKDLEQQRQQQGFINSEESTGQNFNNQHPQLINNILVENQNDQQNESPNLYIQQQSNNESLFNNQESENKEQQNNNCSQNGEKNQATLPPTFNNYCSFDEKEGNQQAQNFIQTQSQQQFASCLEPIDDVNNSQEIVYNGINENKQDDSNDQEQKISSAVMDLISYSNKEIQIKDNEIQLIE